MTDHIFTNISTGKQFNRVRTETTKVDRGHVDFDLVDGRGRKIGVFWHIASVTYSIDAEAYTLLPIDKPVGTYFKVATRTSRDGKGYGASTGDHEFKTETEAREDAAAWVERIRRNNEKKFPRA